MPIYELKCKEGHTYERITSFTPTPEQLLCPTCGGEGERQVSIPGVARIPGGTGAQRNG